MACFPFIYSFINVVNKYLLSNHYVVGAGNAIAKRSSDQIYSLPNTIYQAVPALRPRTNYFTYLNLRFVICKVEIMPTWHDA